MITVGKAKEITTGCLTKAPMTAPKVRTETVAREGL